MLILSGCHDVSLGSRHSSQGLCVQIAASIGADILKADWERDTASTDFLQNAERTIAGGAGVDFPLSRSAAPPKVRLSCDGPTFAMRKPNVELTADAHAVFRRARQNGLVKREAPVCLPTQKGAICAKYAINRLINSTIAVLIVRSI